MLPTPDLSHLTKRDFETVYEPAEDTFLLLDALESHADELRDLKPRICLEVGSGSGCVSTFLAGILSRAAPLMVCTDINPHAALCTQKTGSHNGAALDPVIASLCQPLYKRLRSSVDILLFNPPYVPTDEMEAESAQNVRGITGSWAGGHDGMQVTNVLLSQVKDLLAPGGRLYLVALKQNDIPDITRQMTEQHGLRVQTAMQRRAGREHLFVLCISKPANDVT